MTITINLPVVDTTSNTPAGVPLGTPASGNNHIL